MRDPAGGWPEGSEPEVVWSREGDAWIGTFGGHDRQSQDGGKRLRGVEVELLLRATDWHIEVSHAAQGAFEREHIHATDIDEAKAKAADLLRAFRARCEAPIDDEREVNPST